MTTATTTSTTTMKNTVVVSGAGLVGSLLALGLKARGVDVVLYERRADPRVAGMSGGRSINLALSDRGLLGLASAGVQAAVEEVSIAMPARRMHLRDGSTTSMPYGLSGEAIRSVSRGGLNLTLMQLCSDAGIPIHFEHRCEHVELKTTTATFSSPQGEHVVEAGAIVGADGAFSAVRAAFLKTDRFDYSQSYLPHGYKELTIPPAADGGFRLDKHALHIWPRQAYMLIALPNLDGSFTCTLFFAHEGARESFAALNTPEAARAFFSEVFPDAFAEMADFDEQWRINPVSSLSTVQCGPWVRNTTMLIGDAAHAIVPFFGQGMNAGFEDCRVLFELLDARKAAGEDMAVSTWGPMLSQFFVLRKPNADAIATLALENFVEMREKVGQPAFLYRKQVEAAFARACPDVVTPAYTMVTFRPHLGYAEALQRSRAQDAVLDTLCDSDPVRRHLAGDVSAAEEVAALFASAASRLRS
jgi:kynurenine 3-monooxygenase